jgi:hypothetical protein
MFAEAHRTLLAHHIKYTKPASHCRRIIVAGKKIGWVNNILEEPSKLLIFTNFIKFLILFNNI